MNDLLFRHKRHTPSQCVTCAGQFYRHKRHTPLKGVTDVTLVAVLDGFLRTNCNLVFGSRFLGDLI